MFLSNNKKSLTKAVLQVALNFTAMLCIMMVGMEAASAAASFGEVAHRVTGTFAQIARMITGGAYIAGLGFAIGAILKFKQHKDNPTQIPVGTPIAMMFIASALVFMPSILGMTGQSLFSGGTVGGPTGVVFSGG